MNELTRLALELQTFCEARKWSFCIIGGLAVQHWGEPRFTKDVDITLLTGFGKEEAFVDDLLAVYESRIKDARNLPCKTEFYFSARARVLASISPWEHCLLRIRR